MPRVKLFLAVAPAGEPVTLQEAKDFARVTEPCFRDVLAFCWETGCRVQEVRQIEARHVRLDRGRVELPPPEAKGKKRWRIIYLTDKAKGLVKRLVKRRPKGPLFVNRDRSAKAVDQALAENRMVLLVSQKNPDVDDPKAEDLHNFAVVAHGPAKAIMTGRTAGFVQNVAVVSDSSLIRIIDGERATVSAEKSLTWAP